MKGPPGGPECHYKDPNETLQGIRAAAFLFSNGSAVFVLRAKGKRDIPGYRHWLARCLFYRSRSLQPVSCHQRSRHRLPYRQSSCRQPSIHCWPPIHWPTYLWLCVAQTDDKLVATNVAWPFTGATAIGEQQGGAEEHGLVVRHVQQMLFLLCFQKARSQKNSHLSTRAQSLWCPVGALSPPFVHRSRKHTLNYK